MRPCSEHSATDPPASAAHTFAAAPRTQAATRRRRTMTTACRPVRCRGRVPPFHLNARLARQVRVLVPILAVHAIIVLPVVIRRPSEYPLGDLAESVGVMVTRPVCIRLFAPAVGTHLAH